LVGLVLGLVGTFKKNSSVVLSIAGAVLCGLLLVFIVLSIFMLGGSGLLERLDEQAESAQVDAARTQMKVLEIAIVAYQMDTGTYPPTLDALLVAPPEHAESWQGPYLTLTAVPLDPWDRPYQYIPDEEGLTIFSVGPDGVANTADDVVHVVTW
jgi:general secretion pathway protein G